MFLLTGSENRRSFTKYGLTSTMRRKNPLSYGYILERIFMKCDKDNKPLVCLFDLLPYVHGKKLMSFRDGQLS